MTRIAPLRKKFKLGVVTRTTTTRGSVIVVESFGSRLGTAGPSCGLPAKSPSGELTPVHAPPNSAWSGRLVVKEGEILLCRTQAPADGRRFVRLTHAKDRACTQPPVAPPTSSQ